MYIACYSGQTCDPPHVARVTSSSIGRRFSKQTLNMAHRLQFTNRKHSIDKTVKSVMKELTRTVPAILLLHVPNIRWRSWLRHCATSRGVAGSIPDSVGIFHWHNPSGCTMALGLTQPLTDGRCVGLTTLPPSCVDCLEIWEPQPPGTLRACPGL